MLNNIDTAKYFWVGQAATSGKYFGTTLRLDENFGRIKRSIKSVKSNMLSVRFGVVLNLTMAT